MSTGSAQGNTLRNRIGGKFLTTLVSLLILVGVWHLFGGILGVDTISSPVEVAVFTSNLLMSYEWIPHAAASLGRIAVAFTICMVFGTLFALFLGVTSFWEAVFKDFVVVWMSMPGLIFVIFAAMWFGTGDLTPIVAGALLPMGVTTQIVYESVKDIDNDRLEMARAFDVPRHRILYRVVLQSILPAILTAARLALAGIWMVISLGEYIASSSGLGYVIRLQLQQTSFTGLIGWSLIFVVIIAAIEYGVLARLERRAFAYRDDSGGRL